MTSTSESRRWVLNKDIESYAQSRDFSSLEVVKLDFKIAGSSRHSYGLCIGPDGYIFACYAHSVFRFDSSLTNCRIYAGSIGNSGFSGGDLLQARFSTPLGITHYRGSLYVVQTHGIQRIVDNQVIPYTGSLKSGCLDGVLSEARFNNPTHLAAHRDNFYLTDSFNHRIRRITPEGYVSTLCNGSKVSDISENGTFDVATFRYPRGICSGPDNTILVCESSRSTVRVLDMEKETVAPWTYDRTTAYQFAMDVNYTHTGEIVVCDTSSDTVFLIDKRGAEKSLLAIHGPESLLRYEDTTLRPTASTVTIDGDLILSSEPGALFMIRGLFPAKTVENFNFSSSLRFSSDVSSSSSPIDDMSPEMQSIYDMVVVNQATGYSVSLSSQLAKVLEISNLRGLETCTVPFDTCQDFLRFCFGNSAYLPSGLTASTLSLYCIVAEAIGVPQDFQDILYDALFHAVASLSAPDVDNLASCMRVVRGSSPPEGPLDSVFGRLSSTDKQLQVADISSLLNDLNISSSISSSAALSPSKSRPSIARAAQVPKPLKYKYPSHWLQEKFGDITELLELRASDNNSSTTHSVYPTNFTFEIESSSGLYSIAVHDWVLVPRWTYFARMLNSGFEESRNRKATLPSDFPPTALLALLRFIYCGLIDRASLTVENCEYLLQNGPSYDLCDLNDTPVAAFGPFMRYCKSKLPKNSPEDATLDALAES